MNAKLRVGDWLVDSALSEIREGDRVVRLEQRSVAVLECLAEDAGELVDKARILEKVWPETFVSDEVLTHAIWELRKAFGDDAREPRFIQTIPKKGYRLIAAVTRGNDGVSAALAPNLPADPRPSESAVRGRYFESVPRAAGWAVAVAVLLLGSWAGLKAPIGKPESPFPQPVRKLQLMVLPFKDTTGGAEAGLAEGIAEDLTRLLGQIEGLEVVGRVVADSYAGKEFSAIQEELGGQVEYLLTGKIYRSKADDGKPEVRVSAELVRLGDRSQVWSNSFASSRENREILVEVGQSIIRELEVKLGLSSAVVRASTAYMKGLDWQLQPSYSKANSVKAIELFKLAVEEDPSLVAAWAEMTKAQVRIYFNGDGWTGWLAGAEHDLAQAMRLEPLAREVRLAAAYVEFHGHRNYAVARDLFKRLSADYPSDAEALRGLGYVERRLGLLEQSCAHLEAAARLKPSAELSSFIAETYRAQRRWPEAQRHYQEAADLDPEATDVHGEMALNLFDWHGSAKDARDSLARFVHDRSAEMLYYWLPLDLYDGSYYDAIDRYSHWPRSPVEIDRMRNPWLVARAARLLGQEGRARHLIEENRDSLLECVAETPGNRYCQAYLALAWAYLGQAAPAREAMAKAIATVGQDEFTGPRLRELEAEMEVELGDRQAALGILRQLLATEYQHPISLARLRYDPTWKPLRTEPEFASWIAAVPDP